MTVWLRRGRCQRERNMVEKLTEQGHEVIEIAAAALKLVRAEEQQRPIAPITELREDRPRQAKPAASRRNPGKEKAAGRTSHEKGMVRLALSSGKADGLNVGNIVGSLSHHADIPGRCIGKISIQHQTAFVDVPEDVVNLLLAKKSSYRIGRRQIDIERA
jgi:ATP-dependent RNA helicase DeaD